MATTAYTPVSFGQEVLTDEKLQQLSNNAQWLFDNSPRIRYSANGITKDSGLKMICGKTAFAKVAASYTTANIYFGSYFTPNCRPVVSIGLEGTAYMHKSRVVIQGFSQNGEVDHTGFLAVISVTDYPTLSVGGFIHWTATGY